MTKPSRTSTASLKTKRGPRFESVTVTLSEVQAGTMYQAQVDGTDIVSLIWKSERCARSRVLRALCQEFERLYDPVCCDYKRITDGVYVLNYLPRKPL